MTSPPTDADVERLGSLETTEVVAAGRELLDTTPASLEQVLGAATRYLHRDPSKAQRLIALARSLARDLDAPYLGARCTYLHAIGLAATGDTAAALVELDAADRVFRELGAEIDAARAQVGRSGILAASGDFDGAQRTLEAVIAGLAPAGDGDHAFVLALARQNLGTLLVGRGDFAAGRPALEAAARTFEEHGDTERLVQITTNLTPANIAAGRTTEALASIAALLDNPELANRPGVRGMLTEELGSIQAASGELGSAVASFATASADFETAGLPLDRARVQGRLAMALLDLHLYDEAAEAAQRAIADPDAHRHPQHLGQGEETLGLVNLAADDPHRASSHLDAAKAHYDRGSFDLDSARVDLHRVEALARRSDHDAAAALARDGRARASRQRWTTLGVLFSIWLDRLDPDPATTESLDDALSNADATNPQPPLQLLIDQRRAEAARAAGDDHTAIAHLEHAVEIIERTRSALEVERYRRTFLAGRLAVFDDLFELLVHQGQVRRAFEVAEQARARSLLDSLRHLIDTGAPTDDATITEVRRDIDALYNQLLDDSGPGRSLHIAAADNWLAHLERRLTELTAAPAASHLRRGTRSPTSAAVTQGARNDQRTMVSFNQHGNTMYAFVTRPDGDVELVRLDAAATDIVSTTRRVRSHMERSRLGADFASRWSTQVHAGSTAALGKLHDQVWAPVADLLPDDCERVVVVPAGPLHDVPFDALWDGTRYLVERHEIASAPSAAAWLAASHARPATGPAIVLAGDTERLPYIHSEIEAARTTLTQAGRDVVTVSNAQQLRSHPRPSLLHIASHGVFRSDSPMFSALRLEDSWLTAADINGLDLRGTVVVLSACESGRVSSDGGEIFGLARAFLAAGAVALVGSSWLVEDAGTAALMAEAYQWFTTGTPLGSSLRRAKLNALHRDAHPFSWAPFQVIGAASTRLPQPVPLAPRPPNTEDTQPLSSPGPAPRV